MDMLTINWLAVVACVVISMLSGWWWYNPKTFFPAWWKVIGKGDENPGSGNMGLTWTLTILSSFVEGLAIAVLVGLASAVFGGPSLSLGALTGFLAWLGFIAPTYLVNKLFASHGFKVWAIEAGNHLVNFVLFGALLGVWR